MKPHLPKALLTVVVAALVTPAASGATDLHNGANLQSGENVLAEDVIISSAQTVTGDVTGDVTDIVTINGRGYKATDKGYPAGYSLTLQGTEARVTVNGNLAIVSKCHLNISDGSLSANQFFLGHDVAGNPADLNMSGGTLSVSKIVFRHQNDTNKISIKGGTLIITGKEAITMNTTDNPDTPPTQDYKSTVFIGGEGNETVTLKTGDTNDVKFDYSNLTLGNVTIDADNARAITISNATLTGTIKNQTNEASKLILSGNIALARDSNVVTISDESYYSNETTLSTSSNGYLKATYTVNSTNILTINDKTVFTIDGNEDNKVTYNSADGVGAATFTNWDTYYIHDATSGADYSQAKHLVVDLELDKGDTYKFGTSANTTLESMTIESGKVISEYAGGEAGFMRGDVYIKAGAELKFTTSGNVLGENEQATKSISLSGEVGNVAKLTLADTSSTKLKTNLNLNGNAQVSGGEFSSYGGGITATGTNNTFASKLAVHQDLTVNVSERSDLLTISGKISCYMTEGSSTTPPPFALLVKKGAGTLKITGDNTENLSVRAGEGHLVVTKGVETSDPVTLRGIFVDDGVLEFSGGQYKVGSSHTSDGLFADEYNTRCGSLVLSNGAKLTVDASSNDWRFQVNSGRDGGIYIKGKSEGESGTASILTATLADTVDEAKTIHAQVTFKARDTVSETVAHIAAETSGNGKRFTVDQTNITIENADYTVNYGATNKEVKNKLVNTALINEGTGTLTVDNTSDDTPDNTPGNTLVGVYAKNGEVVVSKASSSAKPLKSVKAEGGGVSLQEPGNGAILSLDELLIGESKTVSALTGTPPTDGSNTGVAGISINSGGTLTVGKNATLNANLTMSGNSTLNVQQGGQKLDGADSSFSSITLNGTLILPTKQKVTLAGDILAALGGLAKDGRLNVFQGVTSLTLGNPDDTGVMAASADADTDLANYFNFTGLEEGSYLLGYTGAEAGGVVYIQKNAPEPTTATLSLLALAALAARRRRKG